MKIVTPINHNIQIDQKTGTWREDRREENSIF